ncbi:hypothetical protein RI129_005425 [Pyrocoelia pectoralis]|uniref:Uncharacterized protein n=1 Tax=Pyrocoelia pectoralis TaxID=417401 RepID=A0AAN7VK38_9COLE
MDLGLHKSDKPNPRENANFFSTLTFWYLWPIFMKARKNKIEMSDLHKTPSSQQSKLLGDKIEKIWRNEELKALQLSKEPSLTRALFKMFGAGFIGHAIVGLFGEVGALVLQPVILGELIECYTMGQETNRNTDIYWFALGLIFCIFFYIHTSSPNTLSYQKVALKMRIACSSLVYRKAIRLSKTALGQATVGQIVNLVSNDVRRFDTFITISHFLWIGPLQTIIGCFIMYQESGISAIIGVTVLLLFIPIQRTPIVDIRNGKTVAVGVAKMNAKLRSKSALCTDERVRLMVEIISGIQVIKMYAWEKPFAKFVSNIRRNEMKFIRIVSYLRVALFSFFPYSSQFCLFISITSSIALNESVTAKKVFIQALFFNLLRKTMCGTFTQATTQLAEVRVSLKRLNTFLVLSEKTSGPVTFPKYTVLREETNTISDKNGTISIRNATAKWNESANELKNINVKIKSGSIVAIIGAVGSGKSSILQLILRELPLAEGDLEICGDISYAPQEPWVFNGTVRQNILFNKPYSKGRYESIISKCSLKRDLELFTSADLTVVGEQGVILSGGQRARISLARAIYREADIYLLDDPLSAVDTHVARELFEECVTGFLHGKTVILVTHQVQFLENVDSIIIIENGTIKAQGTFDELQQSGLEFAKILKTKGVKEEELHLQDIRPDAISAHLKTANGGKVESTLGIVPKDVYKTYMCGGSNWCYILIVLILFVTSQVSIGFGEIFISNWAGAEERYSDMNAEEFNRNETDHSFWYFPRATYVISYTGILVVTIILTISRNLLFNELCMRSSIKLHYNMFNSILRGTMKFFSVHSTGSVLNRFSKDMGTIDDILPILMLNTIQYVLLLLGIVVVISFVNPWFLIPTLVSFVLFYFCGTLYSKTSHSVSLLEAMAKSPVLAHINSSIQALTTIRAFGAESTLIMEFDTLQDLHSEVWFLFVTSSRAFLYYLDLICGTFISVIIFGTIINGNDIPAASVGLVVSHSVGMISLFKLVMRQFVDMDNQMISVERVLKYNYIEHEKCEENEKPPASWPQSGEIRFINVDLHYSSNDPPVLKNVSFTIKPREKVGIVGRTGAGKSSLINALFQLSNTSGSILIDGIDIKRLELEDLRSKISIIPQNPVLFSGTVRKNLDPLGTYSDDLLLKSLEQVELKKLDLGLDSHLSEGGSNFSVGQRQLICLARAILRKNKILVLDEATANVDLQTDTLIQKTIRKLFSQCTVLTIAHRLNTVMDSDKILVMEEGAMIEFDHPYNLLQNTSGVFYGMVLKTGQGMAGTITKVAEENFKKTANTK